jgi:hypothetical protein
MRVSLATLDIAPSQPPFPRTERCSGIQISPRDWPVVLLGLTLAIFCEMRVVAGLFQGQASCEVELCANYAISVSAL